MKYFVYILACSDSSFYVGSTFNIDKRIRKHNEGNASEWTRRRKPVQLVYHEEHENLINARKREQRIKGWSRCKKEKLINGLWNKPSK